MTDALYGRSRMRDLLIEHLDGCLVEIIKPGTLKGTAAVEAALRFKTMRAAIARGWIEYYHGPNDKKITPVATKITAMGREAISAALANWADALDRARVATSGLAPYFAGERFGDELRAILNDRPGMPVTKAD